MNLSALLPLADVAMGPMVATMILVPVLVIAVVIIAAAILVKVIRKRREK